MEPSWFFHVEPSCRQSSCGSCSSPFTLRCSWPSKPRDTFQPPRHPFSVLSRRCLGTSGPCIIIHRRIRNADGTLIPVDITIIYLASFLFLLGGALWLRTVAGSLLLYHQPADAYRDRLSICSIALRHGQSWAHHLCVCFGILGLDLFQYDLFNTDICTGGPSNRPYSSRHSTHGTSCGWTGKDSPSVACKSNQIYSEEDDDYSASRYSSQWSRRLSLGVGH